MTQSPAIIKHAIFSLQVCVPKDWTDDQVRAFANTEQPCGTEHGWHIRSGEQVWQGQQERITCANNSEFVHIVLDA